MQEDCTTRNNITNNKSFNTDCQFHWGRGKKNIILVMLIGPGPGRPYAPTAPYSPGCVKKLAKKYVDNKTTSKVKNKGGRLDR